MAASYGALSADHLEYLDDAGVAAMAAAGAVAVILPGAFYTLRETQAPPIAALRAAGVPMAVATDCNPGSSPMTSLLLAMNMACTLFRLTPEEALAGATRNAARALGLDDCGVIADGDARRPRGLGRRAPRRTRLSHGLEPAGAADLRRRGRMTDPRHNQRDVYPPTGPEITAKSWLTEAPMRMLMNNLHPDVAENPHELVVYGGIGRAARTWADFDRIVASLRTLEADETLLVQSGKPVGGVPHPSGRAAGADRELEPGAALGDLGQVQRARSRRADDVRPDDRRLLDLHRHPGHRAGHLRDLRRGRRGSTTAATSRAAGS